ncbi:NAD-dependent epimerase/dehydratase family protein [Shouchella lonarensis]|uniref:UDP-glucose 4-epimerase n=1 Tax=Shouchella lonarensis TaxID=1464122 RepID=A0A1G6GKR3_9BACI|nr:NAD(P)-dependent oxidoreductase [Shouchella lonarensis]SDB82524.1 UDP-glucose 4-epimerase [Shouchella lonarensis]
METVAVVGGLGFLGFHLCRRLLDEGYKVIAVDPLHTDRAKGQLELEMYLGRHAEFQFERVAIEDYQLPESVTAVIYVANFVDEHTSSLEATFLQCNEERRVIIAMSVNEVCAKQVEVHAEARGFDYMLLQLPLIYGLHQSQKTEEMLLGAREAADTPDWLYIEDAISVLLCALTLTGSHVCKVGNCEQVREDEEEESLCPLVFEPAYTFDEGFVAWQEEKKEWARQQALEDEQ